MKKLVTSYTFDASAKTIDSADFTSLEKILLITNVTDQIIIYSFADTAKGGSLSGTTLTLEHDTSSMDDTDKLQIFVEDASVVQPVSLASVPSHEVTNAGTFAVQASGTVTANAGTNLNTSALALESGGNLASIKAKTDNIPALGQALGSASVPVVLPAAQITTLTPPAAITGFATEAKQLPDGHNVTIANASIPVTGTFWQATQPISGTVTANTGLTQPLTDTQLRATAVPVSGTVAVTNAGITTIAGAVSGTEMQVDVLTMPTTTVTATDLDIRNLTNTDVVTAELSATDNAVLDDIASDTEAIKTSLAGTLTVTGGGGGVQYTEGDTDASITGNAVMFEGNAEALGVVSSTNPLPVSLQSSAVGIAINNGGSTQANVIGAGSDNLENTYNELITGSMNYVFDGSAWDRSPGNSTDGALVNLGTNNDVTVTGTVDLGATDNAVLDTIAAKDFATQTTLAAMNAKMVSGTDIGDVTINNAGGAAAVNIQDGGNTITVDGTVAVTNSDITSIKTAVEIIDNAISGSEMQVDVVGALPAGTNAIGKLAANSGVDIGDVTLTAGTAAVGSVLPPDTDVTAHTNYARKYYTNAGAATDGIIWSPAAGKRWHVVTMYIQVSAAATVTLEDDKAGGDDPVWKGEIAANSGAILSFTEHYPMASGEDAADLLITTTAGNVYVTCVGYEI